MTAHLTRIKSRLAIHAHRKVRGLLEGEYAAIHAGRGAAIGAAQQAAGVEEDVLAHQET